VPTAASFDISSATIFNILLVLMLHDAAARRIYQD
jgi:hypothetical protein